jgi:alpha-glucuronidase
MGTGRRHIPGLLLAACWFTLVALGASRTVLAEDGYDLWLRYLPIETAARSALEPRARSIVGPESPGAVANAARAELGRALSGLLARDIPLSDAVGDGAVVLARAGDPSLPAGVDASLKKLGDEGFIVRDMKLDDHAVILVAATTDTGLLYGVFELIRHLQTGAQLAGIDVTGAPATRLRLLNHWDNLDRYVERGYAGQSIWDWWRLPGAIDNRYTDYARANASIGINGTVLNNVNASAIVLTPRYLGKAATIADTLRPWGIRVYLSARFSAPIEIGGLGTADPLNPDVRRWWQSKADEIYARIPDFGGFLVKANSEGQPGPQDYGRTHADGANMLAGALAPHGGVVMWRAFVYSQDDPEDRVKQALQEFQPLDGQFAPNVLVQVKNGPLDFQPREPFHPMFGRMPETPLMMEFQITQEYLGFSTHLVYLGALYEEVLDADTFASGPGSTVARVIDGNLNGHELSGMAGVANIGTDRNWSGSIFGQANWYAFGRLAWNPARSSRAIAREWLAMTFSRDPDFIGPATALMMRSRQAVVDYMTPLGLAHIMGTGHHYGPAPWVDDLDRPEWNPVYYHRAEQNGIGFDRGPDGSNAVAQYMPEVARTFANRQSVPDDYLLWFHHVGWDERLDTGRTLWAELVARYDHGVAEVEAMRRTWSGLSDYVDPERFQQVSRYLDIQLKEARWWRNACLAYFQAVSGRDWADGVEPPPETLEYYRSLRFPFAPGN